MQLIYIKFLSIGRDSLRPFSTCHGQLTERFVIQWVDTLKLCTRMRNALPTLCLTDAASFNFQDSKYGVESFVRHFSLCLILSNLTLKLTLYLCFLQKLIQFWMVSLLDVSLVPDRVGGSPLSLKQPRFPGTVGRQGEGEENDYTQQFGWSLYHIWTVMEHFLNTMGTFRPSLAFLGSVHCTTTLTLRCLMAKSCLPLNHKPFPHRGISKLQSKMTHSRSIQASV